MAAMAAMGGNTWAPPAVALDLGKRSLRAVGAGASGSGNFSPLFTLVWDQVRTKSLTKRWLGLPTGAAH